MQTIAFNSPKVSENQLDQIDRINIESIFNFIEINRRELSTRTPNETEHDMFSPHLIVLFGTLYSVFSFITCSTLCFCPFFSLFHYRIQFHWHCFTLLKLVLCTANETKQKSLY